MLTNFVEFQSSDSSQTKISMRLERDNDNAVDNSELIFHLLLFILTELIDSEDAKA
jgi:hypothetical protein